MTSLRPDELSPCVLLVEDNPGDARLFEEQLAEGELDADLEWAASLEAGLEAARAENPDLLVLDLELPDSQGLATVQQAAASMSGVPIVVLTGLDQLGTATEALGAGASEYLRKDDLTPALLARTLRIALVRHRLEREADRERALSRSILRSLPEHIAVLDSEGEIRAVNRPWRQFARSEGGDPDAYEGDSYLEVTKAAAETGDEDAREMLDGLQSVLAGERDAFMLEYPCHSPDERRWFQVQVSPLIGEVGGGAVVSHIDITERKEHQRFLDTLIENLPGVLYRCRNDADWTIEYLSTGIRELTGYTTEELQSSGAPEFGDLIYPDDRDRVWDEVQEAIGEDRPFQTEYRIRTREGEEKWIWEQGQKVPSPRREAELLEGYMFDATEKVEARQRLEEAEEKWSTVVDLAPIGIVISDAETGRLINVNRAMASMVGYEPAEVVGVTSDDLSVWVDRDRRGQLVSRLRERDVVQNEPLRLRHASGEVRHTRVSVRLMELSGEDRLLWTVQDVTEQRKREAALRESEARHRTLVETMAEATIIMNAEGQITFANTEANQLLGLERSDLAEHAYDDPDWGITAPGGGTFPESELPFRRVMDTGRPVRNVEHAITRPDGTRTILSVNAAPLNGGEDGSPDGVVATIRDVTEQKQLEAQLEHQALHDPLTGLANRTLFEDRLEQALARSGRRGQPMGLLMLDIDAFKRINDSLGHTVGDDVLEQVGRRLERSIRDSDTAARWGGDEFVVVLPELESTETIETLQHRLRQAIEVPFQVGGDELEVTITVGGVVHTTEDVPGSVATENPEDLVRFVDLALHRAKSRPAGGFYQFDPTDKLDEIPDLRLEQDLRRGLEADEIEAFYQPIYRLDDHTLWGIEALARWRHPERGLVPPGEFIPLAERVGLIYELGDAVCQKSCRQVAAWNAERNGGAALKISVNLSAHQLQDPDLTSRMRGLMEGKGISPDQVVLEVTETAMMKTVGQARGFRALGVSLFIDDFGTGYSTFTYLRELDADGLKIDMDLVQGLPGSESDAAIIEAMIGLADRLGLLVVAEGIETQAQLDTLRELGCHLGQGFYLGRPMPAAEVESLLNGS